MKCKPPVCIPEYECCKGDNYLTNKNCPCELNTLLCCRISGLVYETCDISKVEKNGGIYRYNSLCKENFAGVTDDCCKPSTWHTNPSCPACDSRQECCKGDTNQDRTVNGIFIKGNPLCFCDQKKQCCD